MRRLLLALALIGLSWPAAAQYLVVATCGTPPATLTAGMRLDGFMDTSGTICTNAAGGGGGGGGSVTQGTSPWVVSGAAGAALASASAQTTGNTSLASILSALGSPLQAGGVIGALPAGTALIGKVGVDQTTPGTTNAVSLAQIGGTTVVNGGVAGSQSVGGTVATNVAITSNPLNLGAQAVSSENTAVTTARQVQLVADVVGRLITFPYANKENLISGAASVTDTSATTIIASAGGSLKNYITGVQCYRSDTGTTAITVTFNDSATTKIVLPAAGANFAGSGSNIVFQTPIATAAATAFTFTSGSSITTVYCNAQGFKGV